MYFVIVYDVSVGRVNKINKFLKQYLCWVQNSVFEGELSVSQFKEVEIGIKDIIDKENDSILIFQYPSKKSVKIHIIGVEKNPEEWIL